MNFKKIGMTVMAAAAMFVGSAMTATPAQAATRFSIGIGVGPRYGYAPPVVAYRPAYPGPGYYWNDGYYDPYGRWFAGAWRTRAYVGPRPYGGGGYYGGGYYNGYRGGYRQDFRGRGNAFGRRR